MIEKIKEKLEDLSSMATQTGNLHFGLKNNFPGNNKTETLNFLKIPKTILGEANILSFEKVHNKEAGNSW